MHTYTKFRDLEIELAQLTDEHFLANVVQFLIDGNELDAANVLLSCSLTFYEEEIIDPYIPTYWNIILSCPRPSYDLLNGKSSIREQIESACTAICESCGAKFNYLEVNVALATIAPDWRTELEAIARGQNIHNQIGEGGSGVKSWNNLRFRSVSEIRIAQALDRANVLFLPNCRARLSTPEGRMNKEADFLICNEGKWGILEVDGEPFHPATRTVHDHERDRLFRLYGVKVVEHFDAGECFENANSVVQKFLTILKNS